jgi:hypothetical protein
MFVEKLYVKKKLPYWTPLLGLKKCKNFVDLWILVGYIAKHLFLVLTPNNTLFFFFLITEKNLRNFEIKIV